ncbi:hypothetical protein HLB23_17285 [Nocardia uniformis]|uniref:Uncharacterized protein n=1 Tax=Nocardia uniformis TaxID=53432 RepID=A0A849C5A3_9NOCA|nr:hypothetical protein [Nocardia uniformis]NNH71600.1 hypothetical protein [Nocardia uniformis]
MYDSAPPTRPAAVALGVPFLAALWAGLIALPISGAIGSTWDSTAVFSALLWTAVWYAMLYRVWRGGPAALQVVSQLAVWIPGICLIGLAAMAITLGSRFDILGALPWWWWTVLFGYAGAFAVGILLRRSDVRAWSTALHPPESRAEAALRNVPVPAAPASGGSDEVAPAGPLAVDLGERLRSHARMRLGCFGLLLICFFPGLPLIVGIVTLIRDGDPQMALVCGGLLLVLALCLAVSTARFRRRLGPGSRISIDDPGITWDNSMGENTWFGWDQLSAVGISYHLAKAKGRTVMHMPQLELFDRYPDAYRPALTDRSRTEEPPQPHLPRTRFRLMLPPDATIHADLEAAVTSRRPRLWLGWYPRAGSDTPWFLR